MQLSVRDVVRLFKVPEKTVYHWIKENDLPAVKVGEQYRFGRTELLEWARSIALQASLKATIECMRSFSSTDFRPDLAAINVPTLLIHGTEDKTVPIAASSRLAAQSIAQSTLIEYDGAPHGLFATDKDRLTGDLLAFLARAA